jgi:hypothetical protein
MFPSTQKRDEFIRVHSFQQLIQFPIGEVALHLGIPLVVLPAMQTARQLRSLFRRELRNGGFDFFDCHEPEYSRSLCLTQEGGWRGQGFLLVNFGHFPKIEFERLANTRKNIEAAEAEQ